MKGSLRPNKAEKVFLSLAYNRFYNLFCEIMEDSFWEKDEWYRFCKVKDAFAIYSELLNYEPIKWIIGWMKKGGRPPMQGEIGVDLFRFVRNLISHFPYFESWNSVWINKLIVNWNKEGRSIDQFLEKYKGRKEVKYRFWESSKKRMTYLSIKFHAQYKITNKIFLKDIISERDGIKFSMILMRKILDTQVEEIDKNPSASYI